MQPKTRSYNFPSSPYFRWNYLPVKRRCGKLRTSVSQSAVLSSVQDKADFSGEAAPLADESVCVGFHCHLIDEGELVILSQHPSLLFIILNPLGSLFALALLTVIAYFGASTSPVPIGRSQVVASGISLILIRLGWSCLEWWCRIYILTDRRIIRRKGVLRVSIFQAPLRRVQHVTMYFSIRERVFALGTIGFATAGTGIPEAYWEMISKPLDVYRKVISTIDKYAGSPGSNLI